MSCIYLPISMTFKLSPPAALSSVVDVVITVEDVNDNSPRFSRVTYTRTIPELLAVGEPVIQVNKQLFKVLSL